MNLSHFNFSSFQFWGNSSLLFQNADSENLDSDRTFQIYLYAFTMFLSFSANVGLVSVILGTKSLRTKFNFYVVNFSLVNLLIPTFCMWLHLVYHLDKGQWRFGEFFCRINVFLQADLMNKFCNNRATLTNTCPFRNPFLVVCVSNLTLTVTITDRFLATLQSPLQKYTQDHMVIVMLIVWVFGVLLSLPYILYTRFLEFDWIGGHERLCQAHFPSMESRRAYVTIFCLVGYVLPLLVMFFLISVSLRRPGVPNDSMPREERTRCKMRRRALHYVFTVLIVFFLCWSPQQFLMLWDVFRDRGLHAKLPKNIREYSFYSFYVAYASSCVYPILYMTYNKGFRFAVKQILRCKRQINTNADVTSMEIGEQLSTVNNMESFDISTVRIDTDDHMTSCPATSGLSAEPKLDIVTIDGHLQTSKM